MRNRPLRTLGIRLREARERKELLQREVAEKIGCHTMTVSKYERDAQDPSSKNLAALAELYDVSADWLLVEHGDFTQDFLSSLDDDMNMVMSLPSLALCIAAGNLPEEGKDKLCRHILFLCWRDRRRRSENATTQACQGRRCDPDM